MDLGLRGSATAFVFLHSFDKTYATHCVGNTGVEPLECPIIGQNVDKAYCCRSDGTAYCCGLSEFNWTSPSVIGSVIVACILLLAVLVLCTYWVCVYNHAHSKRKHCTAINAPWYVRKRLSSSETTKCVGNL